ncbi:MAG: ABC transporter permease [Bryobacteraceae bacterium]
MPFNRYFRRRRWDDERRRELEAHIELEAQDNVARGMSAEDARAAASRRLGNATLIREEIYRMNTLQFAETAWKDLRHGTRLLARNPGFAVVAVLSLALGIGANTAIFELLDTVRLRTLPVERPRELAEVAIPNRQWYSGNFNGRSQNMSFPLWEQIRDRQQAFSSVAAWGTTPFDLTQGGEARYANGLWVSGDFFRTLGVRATVGRLLGPEDDRRGCGSPAAVLSDAFWQREYAGDPAVLGKTILLSGHPFVIAGVTAPAFFGVEIGRQFDVAVPLCAEPMIRGERTMTPNAAGWWLGVIGRLKPGWSVSRAAAHIETLSPSMIEQTVAPEYDESDRKAYRAFRLSVVPWASGTSDLREEFANPLWMLQGIAGLVLLIACANLANLMLARASAREREIAVRLAVGASRGRLIRQLLAESLLLAGLGAAVGFGLAELLTRVLVGFLSTESDPLSIVIHTDARILLFVTGLAVFTTLLFGLTPALRATCTSPSVAMKAGGRGLTGERSTFDLRRLLVVSQVGLSLVLLCAALLFVRSLQNLVHIDTGFRHEGILLASADYRRLELPKERRGAFQLELLEKVQAIPGIESAAAASIVPLTNSSWSLTIDADGSTETRKRGSRISAVSHEYFRVMDMRLLTGRTFDQRDSAAGRKVAVVTEAFAKTFFPKSDPVGRTFRTLAEPDEPQTNYEVIGVVRDSKYQDVREKFRPLFYASIAQYGNGREHTNFLVRSTLPKEALASSITRAVTSVRPEISLGFRNYDQQIMEALTSERLMAMLAGVFGGLAGVLAVIGLYGVISYTVARRRAEIGIRMALGADRREVVRMILQDACWMLAAGLVLGVVLTLGVSRTAESLLYGLSARDPLTLGAAMALLAVAALAASYLPAWRASRIDPMTALREE